VPTQSRLSILAACEDPTTIGSFDYNGAVWPLPQTGQMWLEYELLKHPEYPGVFCQSTSYRQEGNPVPGRHDLIFPMFEFESRGSLDDLIALETDLCLHLGFESGNSGQDEPTGSENLKYPAITYESACRKYAVDYIGADQEEALERDFGNVVFLKEFPERTSPFWNMRRNGINANKVDVIVHGIETIGSAERETDPMIMKDRFHSISDGMYSDLLFAHFGKERVLAELDAFLDLPMVERFGGGIGMTRLIRGLKLEGKLAPEELGASSASANPHLQS
jgi:aspartyl/asparaginyl-tRNA synthetase